MSDYNGGGRFDTQGVIVKSPLVSTATATIASTISGAIDLTAAKLVGIQMSTAWTAANLSFQVSIDGTNYYDMYDQFGVEFVVSVGGPSRYVALDPTLFTGTRYIKIRSGVSAATVTQAASRDLILALQA